MRVRTGLSRTGAITCQPLQRPSSIATKWATIRSSTSRGSQWATPTQTPSRCALGPSFARFGCDLTRPLPCQNTKGVYDTYWGHQLVSKASYDNWFVSCKDGEDQSQRCKKLGYIMDDEVGNLNPYALDYPVCLEGGAAAAGRAQRNWFMDFILDDHEQDGRLGAGLGSRRLKEAYEPCVDNYAV